MGATPKARWAHPDPGIGYYRAALVLSGVGGIDEAPWVEQAASTRSSSDRTEKAEYNVSIASSSDMLSSNLRTTFPGLLYFTVSFRWFNIVSENQHAECSSDSSQTIIATATFTSSPKSSTKTIV